MGYDKALELAWKEIEGLADESRLSVKLLSDTYEIQIPSRSIVSVSCNVPAKEHISIILLHYVIRRFHLKALPEPTGEWVDFNQLEGGEGYYPAFKKRTIDQLIRKFGDDPGGLLRAGERFPSKRSATGDAGVIFYPLEYVPIMLTIWKADEEFGSDANIVFDKDISAIFCTEDIVVLTEFLTHQL